MTGHSHGDAGGDKRTALIISLLALFLAISETGAKSTQTEALAQNVHASDLWAFFQARTIRQTVVRTASEQAELTKGLTGASAEAIAKRQADWKATIDGWESDPKSGEGRKELAARAKEAEKKRDHAMAAYHNFEYGSAIFQVAIVLASAAIITAVPAMTLGASLLGLVGLALTGLGFFAPEMLHSIFAGGTH